MTVSRWFGVLPPDLASSGRAVLEAMIEMLNVVQPQALDLERSHVVTSGHGWAEYEAEFRLAHADDPEADITVAVGSEEALLSWSMAHEHVYADDGDAVRPWTTVVVDAVAALLRGGYEVRDHYRGDRLVETSVHDTLLGDRHVSTSGSLFGLRPIRRRADRVERRTVDFRCRG